MRSAKILIFAVLAAAAVFWLFGMPRLGLARRERVNGQMKELVDRAKSSPPDSDALNLLIQKLSARDSFERYAAAANLGKVGPAAEPGVDALVVVLEGNDLYAAREAAISLGEIGPGARRATAALLTAIRRYPSADIGWFAAESAGKVASITNSEVEVVLTEAAGSTDSRMQHNARSGLESFQARRAAGEHSAKP